jgi:branched-chain amino acid transport system ATP-binding protein
MALSIRGLEKSFGSVRVLRGLDLDVPMTPDSAVAVLGQNGAGKTTLLNIVTRIVPPDAGKVRVFDEDVLLQPAHRLVEVGIGRTFQMPRLMLEDSCLDNVMVGAIATLHRKRRRMRAAAEVSAAALERTGLLAQARRRAGDLPFGTRKLVELARALASAPRLLLLDEPAAGLSDAEERRLVDVLCGVRASGIALLLIEHRMALVTAVATRVVMLDAGRLVFDGTAEETVASPVVRERYLGAGFDTVALGAAGPGQAG